MDQQANMPNHGILTRSSAASDQSQPQIGQNMRGDHAHGTAPCVCLQPPCSQHLFPRRPARTGGPHLAHKSTPSIGQVPACTRIEKRAMLLVSRATRIVRERAPCLTEARAPAPTPKSENFPGLLRPASAACSGPDRHHRAAAAEFGNETACAVPSVSQ